MTSQPEPTAHDRLIRAGLSHTFAYLVLNQHAHQLAERLRNVHGSGEGDAWNWRDAAEIPAACADLIDPAEDAAMTTAADEIRQAANKLRRGMWTVHPDIATPLAKVMESFANTEFDPEATVQETDGSHRRMLRLARAIIGGRA